jgi:hypothetical protein
VELLQLGFYLQANGSGNLLGDLYRMTTEMGNVKWVCRDHYRAGYQEYYMGQQLKLIDTAKGTFDEQLVRTEVVFSASDTAAKFYDAVRKARGIIQLDISLRWPHHYSDFASSRIWSRNRISGQSKSI